MKAIHAFIILYFLDFLAEKQVVQLLVINIGYIINSPSTLFFILLTNTNDALVMF